MRGPPSSLKRRVVRLDVVGSTNDVARQLAELGWPEGTVVVAREQTAGRGRFGRRWESPSGGLWFSVILRPRAQPEELLKLPVLASLAVARALRRLYGLEAQLKWPNDVLVGGRKICGVLAESSFSGDSLDFVILGIGVNANFEPSALPEPVASSSTTLRAELGHDVDLEELLTAILAELERCYTALLSGEERPLIREAEELMGLPRPVRVRVGQEELSGEALGLDREGRLLLRLPDGRVLRVSWADATVVDGLA